MRRIVFLAVAALALTACSQDTTSPDSLDLALDAGASGTALTLAGGYEAGIYQDRLVNGLPDELKLTPEQVARIRELIQIFERATRDDREAFAAILREARRAIAAHKPRNEISRILAKGIEIRARLAAAEARLKNQIDAVLTPEQRAWIADHAPKRCDPSKFSPLSDAQKDQIRALEDAFRENNKADTEAVRAIFEEVREAVHAGKSRAEVAAIMEKAKAPIARLATARKSLHDQIIAVLTPEQRASRCLPLG